MIGPGYCFPVVLSSLPSIRGCLAKVQVPLPKRVKLGPKTIDCVFIGYANNSAAYRFLVIKSGISDIQVNTIIESNNAEWFEHIFPYKDRLDKNKRKMPEYNQENEKDIASSSGVQNKDLEPNKSTLQEKNLELRRGKRIKVPKEYRPDF